MTGPVLLAALGLASLSTAPTAIGATATGSETREYQANIVSGTGRYTNATGRVAITLIETQRTPSPEMPFRQPGPEFALSVTLHGARCRRRSSTHLSTRPCLALSGAITGSAVQLPHNPDGGGERRIRAASGRTTLLGNVTAVGAYTGTGFIARGRRSIRITIKGRSGAITVDGRGPLIGGFQAP